MRPSRGFTLIEVVVALALAASVVLMAERLYGGLLDAVTRAAEVREHLDRWANGRRFLTQLVGSLEVGTVSGSGFEGRAQSLSFTTWFPDSHGWPERRRVTVAAERGGLVLTGLADSALVLAESVASLDFDYLMGFGAEVRWVRGFISEVSSPLAVRVRIGYPTGADTLVLIVGARG